MILSDLRIKFLVYHQGNIFVKAIRWVTKSTLISSIKVDKTPLLDILRTTKTIPNMANPYEHLHKSLNGPGDSRPTAAQILEDQHVKGKRTDKTIMITGCSSGLGVETARVLLETGATLYLTARNLEKARTALGPLTKSACIHLLELDLNSLASVRHCAQTFLSQSSHLNILIANAGVMATPEGRTTDGFETQFGTNHLSHFLLIQHLLPTRLHSSSPKSPSRIILLSSVAHRHGEVDFSDLNFDAGYNPWASYASSKTANLYTANELDRRYSAQNLHAWSVHPGVIATGLTQHMSAEQQSEGAKANPELGGIMKSVEQGAATTVWAATAEEVLRHGGRYLEDCGVAREAAEGWGMHDPGFAGWAYDGGKAGRLWDVSMEMVREFLPEGSKEKE